MEEPSTHTSSRLKDWTLNAKAFHGLLSWLDEGGSSSGRSYMELRRRLVAYFDHKNCPAAEDLADETLNRVARTLQEKGTIENVGPAQYCYITARFVFLEDLRDRQNYRVQEVPARQASSQVYAPDAEAEKLDRENMLDCLEQCTNKLSRDNRDLILTYYIGKQRVKIENRRALAQQLRISVNALSIRACRIREKLAACVKECLDAG